MCVKDVHVVRCVLVVVCIWERNALLQKVVQVFKALCAVSCRQAVAIDATQELLKRLTKVSVSHGGCGGG